MVLDLVNTADEGEFLERIIQMQSLFMQSLSLKKAHSTK